MEGSLVISFIILIAIIFLIVGMILLFNSIKTMKKDDSSKINQLSFEVSKSIGDNISNMSSLLSDSQRSSAKLQEERLSDMTKKIDKSIAENDKKLNEIQLIVDAKLQKTLDGVSQKMDKIVIENNRQLEKIQDTVDEKLQKTLENRISKSFQLVSERLEQVYKGLGEMQSLAMGVGDLKRVLSNVKTRGILGEVQLGAILSEILSPTQYEENVLTRPNAKERVEFAVKMPGRNEDFLYLPIDAKFHGDTYEKLLDAYDEGDKEEVLQKRKDLANAIKKSAAEISKKYINPPHTTDFAIMFLPFEGLYAEVINLDLVEELQKLHKINIAGPSTMAAMLNSLQMGFNTLAIQKHSSKVWKVLSDAKVEFEKFEDILIKTQQRINQANSDLDKLVGARTRQINKILRDIGQPEEYEGKLISDNNFLERD